MDRRAALVRHDGALADGANCCPFPLLLTRQRCSCDVDASLPRLVSVPFTRHPLSPPPRYQVDVLEGVLAMHLTARAFEPSQGLPAPLDLGPLAECTLRGLQDFAFGVSGDLQVSEAG